MILAVAALLCLTLFQNCDHNPNQGIRDTSRLHGHILVPTSLVASSLKSAQHSTQ